jgi:hypothetical protein
VTGDHWAITGYARKPGTKFSYPVFAIPPYKESCDEDHSHHDNHRRNKSPDRSEGSAVAPETQDAIGGDGIHRVTVRCSEEARPSENTLLPEQSPIPRLSRALGYVVKQYQLAGLVGEERNIAQLFLTAITRHLGSQYRRHAMPQGETGAGKTTLVRKVLAPFWHDVEQYTRLTGAGLDRKEESMDGKILFIEQIQGSEPSQLKFLMTEGQLSILVAERDKDSGRYISRTHRLKGMPVVITTLVGAEVDPQLLSRVSTLEIDQSEDQTKRIVKKKLERWEMVSIQAEFKVMGPISWIDGECRDLGRCVEDIKVPFARQLEEGLPSTLPMRRAVDRILSLVAAAAFLKAALGLRPLVELKTSPGTRQIYVTALPEDLDDALYCLGNRLVESATYFFGRAKDVYDCLSSAASEMTSSAVAVQLKMSQNRAGEYLRLLMNLGHATRTRQGREYVYSAVLESKPRLEFKATLNETELWHWFRMNFGEGSAELVIPDAARQLLTPSPSAVSVVSLSEKKEDTIEPIVPKEATIPTIVSRMTPDDYGANTTKEDARGFVLRAATALTREKGQATMDDLEAKLAPEVPAQEIRRWMETFVNEGLADVDDWGKWHTTRS